MASVQVGIQVIQARSVLPRVTLAGRIMLGAAGLGLLASLLGVVVGWSVVSDLERGVGQSLTLTSTALETIDESTVVIESALEVVVDGVTEAELGVTAMAAGMAEGEVALAALTALTGEDVADALEAVADTLPAVERAARTIDQALLTLQALPFGFSYDAEQPLGEAIGEIRSNIADLPEELRSQSEQAEDVTRQLSEATEHTRQTARSMRTLGERLEAARLILQQYGDATSEARELIADQQAALGTSIARARLALVGFGLAFALAQFVPFYLGVVLASGELPLTAQPTLLD